MLPDTSEWTASTQAPASWHPQRTGVLLIHGLTGSPREMRPLEKALQRAGYRTAVPLIAGHGGGHEELLATVWQDWRDGLRHDLHELARTCDDVMIVGLCIGGLLGLLLAADEKKVRGLVSLSPDLKYRVPGLGTPWTRFLLPLAYRVPWLMRHGYWTQRPPYGLKNPKLQQRVARAVRESVRGQTKDFGTFRMYAGTFRQLEWLQEAARQHLTRVRCPTLIVHSFEDSLFSIRNAAVMYHLLGSRRKEIAFMTGCDHVITVDFRKDEVARRVIRFIAQCHDVFVEETDDMDVEGSACEISPGLRADPEKPEAHTLIVRKGKAERLVLQLFEAAACRGSRVSVPRPGWWGRSPREDDELTTEWELARTAIDALAFGLEKRLTIVTDPESDACAASARKTLRSMPSPVFGETTRI